jgi:glucose/arabinose dehydrogenase
VWGNADWLWLVDPDKPALWYGWPEYADGRPLTATRYKPPGEAQPTRLWEQDPNLPPAPRALFATHASADGIAISRNAKFGHLGDAFVAQFGDQSPITGKVAAPTGFKVVKVDLTTGGIEDFAVNHGPENGPASLLDKGGLERPVSVSFSPDGALLYVVDFGIMTVSDKGSHPVRGTGVLWRIKKTGER